MLVLHVAWGSMSPTKRKGEIALLMRISLASHKRPCLRDFYFTGPGG